MCYCYTGPVSIKKKRRSKNRFSFPNSPCGSDLEGRPLNSPKAASEAIQERLRYLADSWADVETPSCGQIQFVACSDTLIWAIDNHDHIFYTVATSKSHVWKKLDGKAMQIACNHQGNIIWCIDRQKVAHYRSGIKDSLPQGIVATFW